MDTLMMITAVVKLLVMIAVGIAMLTLSGFYGMKLKKMKECKNEDCSDDKRQSDK